MARVRRMSIKPRQLLQVRLCCHKVYLGNGIRSILCKEEIYFPILHTDKP